MNYIGYLKTVLIHKYYVFRYCCKAEIPLQGIIHDMSKFSPAEFFEGAKYYHPVKIINKEHYVSMKKQPIPDIEF